MAAESGYDKFAADIEAIGVLPRQIYAIRQDKKSRKIFSETTGHEILEVRRDSFAKGFRPDEIRYAECILIKYKGEYMLNGMFSGNPDLKPQWEKQPVFLSYEQQRRQAQEWIEIMDGRQVECVSSVKKILQKLGLPELSDNIYDKHSKNFIVLLSKELGISNLTLDLRPHT